MHRVRIFTVGIFVVVFLCLIILQVWLSWESQNRAEAILRELEVLKTTKLDKEKLRQEMIALRIENEQKAIFFQTFFTNFSITVGIIAALSGAWIGVYQYLNIRQKGESDRTANDLNQLWKGITNDDNKTRAGSIAGLQQFLSPDKREFHERVASALALAGRLSDDDPVIMTTLTPIIEHAMKKIPEVMRQVSWQRLKLYRANFAGIDLSNFDFRDCTLIETDFRGAILKGTQFNATQFLGAKLDRANLAKANLEYADLANASLKEANLQGANLHHIKILHADFEDANLIDAKFSEHTTDWRLSKNWRTARFDYAFKKNLIREYGPPVRGPRILMLVWEFPPMIVGGAWTAGYHFFKNLRKKQGANMVALVPWGMISYQEFGNEIEIIPVGPKPIEKKQTKKEPYSPYSNVIYSPSSSSYSSAEASDSHTSTPSIFEEINLFMKRACEIIEENDIKFDVIHAQDWLTFPAGEEISKSKNKPWIAHFHSIEADRRRVISEAVKNIEQSACNNATHIVVTSHYSKQRLSSFYNASEDKIAVVPNCLSKEKLALLSKGEFQTKRVIFTGRLSWQKGPDIFMKIAHEVYKLRPETNFVMYGKGDMLEAIRPSSRIRDIHIPPEEFVQGAGRFHHVEIDQLEVISYNPAEKVETSRDKISCINSGIRRWDAIISDKKKLKELQQLFLEKGFTAYPVKIGEYTHRIVVNDTGGDLHENYLAKIDGLKKVQINSKELVSFQGFKKWKERGQVFDGATLCVVPSRFEPFGMVVLEAMQAGVPVIFMENAGVGEVIKSGIAIDINDVKSIAEQIVSILNNKAEWQRISGEQLKEISEYSERDYESRLVELWEKIRR